MRRAQLLGAGLLLLMAASVPRSRRWDPRARRQRWPGCQRPRRNQGGHHPAVAL